ncbi:MAG: ATP synthase F1 subunit gamma [Eubacteriales bacterium]|jgi:F-type H+-transporting ATPase subunit gamma|nr:ATP synthase F1 subunit gamma [Eubacteriales bacterium]
MASIKSIKQRKANVSTTRQIMKAMNMVSSAKLGKAKERLSGARPFFDEIKAVIDDLKYCQEVEGNIFVKPRPVKNTAYIIITSGRGLCGSYNTNIAEEALSHIEREGKKEKLVVVGAKGKEFFKKRGKNIVKDMEISEAGMYEDTKPLVDFIKSLYISEEVDEVFIAYTHFKSILSYNPRVEKILPIAGQEDSFKKETEINFEPDINSFLNNVMPLYLHTYIYAAMAESAACEHAARMISMDSASKNAADIIEELNLMYNRKRQAAITQELSEIVGGANILQ